MFKRRKKPVYVDPLTDAERDEMTRRKKEAFENAKEAKRQFDEAFDELQGFIDLNSFLKGSN